MSDWIKCSERLPECLHECTTEDVMVSQSVLVCDGGVQSLGMAHMRQDGTWKMYGGDHDFMYPDPITHWMPFPDAPK